MAAKLQSSVLSVMHGKQQDETENYRDMSRIIETTYTLVYKASADFWTGRWQTISANHVHLRRVMVGLSGPGRLSSVSISISSSWVSWSIASYWSQGSQPGGQLLRRARAGPVMHTRQRDVTENDREISRMVEICRDMSRYVENCRDFRSRRDF
jgi:hypothetical protein